MTSPIKSSTIQDAELTSSLSPYLDLHMMFPLLEFVDETHIQQHQIYSPSSVQRTRLDLVEKTHMVDYANDIYQELNGPPSADVSAKQQEKKAQVFSRLAELNGLCQEFESSVSIYKEERAARDSARQHNKSLENDNDNDNDNGDDSDDNGNNNNNSNNNNNNNNSDSQDRMPIPEFTVDWSIEGMGGEERLLEYYSLAKFNYECGDYQRAKEMIEVYIDLHAPSPRGVEDEVVDEDEGNGNKKKGDKEKTCYGLTSITPAIHAALWGNLSCCILLEDWSSAFTALNAVKFAIEVRAGTNTNTAPNSNSNSNSSDNTLLSAISNSTNTNSTNNLTSLEALQQRTWLLHWGLFVFWNNSKKGLDNIIDLFTQEKYMQAIQTNAPHLLRYLAAAIIINKQRRGNLKDLVKVIQHNHCSYSDAITNFVDCLYVKFDFEGAQRMLADCELVLQTDFFLAKQTSLFMEEARVFIFENYCRIHRKIHISNLGEKLAMKPEEAEKWIVDLIRNAFLDAKIDANENCVIMGHKSTNVYSQVIHKTKDATVRSGACVGTLNHHLMELKKEKAKVERAKRESEY